MLELLEAAEPEPAADEVLIRVRATGVGPWDTKLRAGLVGTDFPLPWVIGSECAGVIDGTGEEVFSWAHIRGTYAELVAAPAAWVAPKPSSLSFEQAAALALTGSTAHQVVTENLALRSGETVLVTGASGGVGGFAVQIAAAEGARVVALARPESAGFVRDLGATEVVSALDETAGVDALLDCVGGELLPRALAALREGGRAVTLTPPVVEDSRVSFVWAEPDGARLSELARLVEEGRLRVELEQVLALEQAARAHELIEAGGRRGKIALTVS